MKTSTIIFPSAYALWKYKQVCKVLHLKVDFDTYTLTGDFKKEDINKAINEFNAKLVEAG
jgi:hypothetical protein